MKKNLEEMIQSLLFDEDAKAFLITEDRILNSESSAIRESSFAPLVVAGEGCGLSMYAKAYSAIVDASIAQKIRGSETFIELGFPKNNEEEERRFFASPRLAASIRNRFYGTMCISFDEFDGQDLIQSESLEKLIDFVEENKANIHFIFHILPEFSAKNKLIAALQTVVDITEVHLEKPDADIGYTYFMKELCDLGYQFDDATEEYIKDTMLPIVVSQKAYSGFKSLNLLVERLNLETVYCQDRDDRMIDRPLVDRLLNKYEQDEYAKGEQSRIGFRL